MYYDEAERENILNNIASIMKPGDVLITSSQFSHCAFIFEVQDGPIAQYIKA